MSGRAASMPIEGPSEQTSRFALLIDTSVITRPMPQPRSGYGPHPGPDRGRVALNDHDSGSASVERRSPSPSGTPGSKLVKHTRTPPRPTHLHLPLPRRQGRQVPPPQCPTAAGCPHLGARRDRSWTEVCARWHVSRLEDAREKPSNQTRLGAKPRK
jgi:hypothetical protein